jgi:hypothetical protein
VTDTLAEPQAEEGSSSGLEFSKWWSMRLIVALRNRRSGNAKLLQGKVASTYFENQDQSRMCNHLSTPQRPSFLHECQHRGPRSCIEEAGPMEGDKAADEQIDVQQLHHILIVQKPFLRQVSAGILATGQDKTPT